MLKEVMACGVDCFPGDDKCNGYCFGETDRPPEATEEQLLARAKAHAIGSLTEAVRAWGSYADLCKVGQERETALTIFKAMQRIMT